MREAQVSYMHVQMEAWTGYYAETWAEIQTFKTAPKILNSMGCSSQIGVPEFAIFCDLNWGLLARGWAALCHLALSMRAASS